MLRHKIASAAIESSLDVLKESADNQISACGSSRCKVPRFKRAGVCNDNLGLTLPPCERIVLLPLECRKTPTCPSALGY